MTTAIDERAITSWDGLDFDVRIRVEPLSAAEIETLRGFRPQIAALHATAAAERRKHRRVYLPFIADRLAAAVDALDALAPGALYDLVEATRHLSHWSADTWLRTCRSITYDSVAPLRELRAAALAVASRFDKAAWNAQPLETALTLVARHAPATMPVLLDEIRARRDVAAVHIVPSRHARTPDRG